jgi:alginate O-acetyltransferase complex protein AlgI
MGEKNRITCPVTGLRGHRLFVMASNIILNLAILGYFKYFNFFQTEAVALLNAIGFNVQPIILQILLPVGISFYTFQALSYSIDIYRGNIKPTKDMVAFFAYISFFPQLVAGPIERATNLLPQILKHRHFEYAYAVDGCRQMLWGFFKKMVVADNCATLTNGFEGFSDVGMAIWVRLFCFTVQIYCDFSGYSDIAIGCSRLFGIKLMQNFKYPYFSRDIAEFWRRWHISLSTWFRDYLYIPLGGSHCTKLCQVRNTFAIFLTSGFWHGANWTFIVWGAIHAICLLPLMLFRRNRNHIEIVSGGRLLPSVYEFFQILTTFSIVMFAWLFFRAPSISTALLWLKNIILMKGGYQLSGIGFGYLPYILPWITILFVVEWINREYSHGLARLPQSKFARYTIYSMIGTLCLIEQGASSQFIYFQF